MIANCPVPADHAHIAELTFARVAIAAIGHELIGIAVLVGTMTSENEDSRHARGR